MSRAVLILIAVISGLVAGSSCKSRGPCEDVDSEFEPGLDATGFSLGTNGRGFLSTIRRIGDCSGRTEGWIYSVDVNARTSTAIQVDFWPGKVASRPDGEVGAVMGYRDHLGLVGNAPPGLVRLTRSDTSLVPLGDAVWDFQSTADGWVASAGGAGSWKVDATGDATPFEVGPSYCGDEAEGAFFLCTSSGISVVGSNGTISGVIPLPDPPSYVIATTDLTLAFNGTNVAFIRNLSLNSQYAIGLSTWRAWLSPEAGHAFINASSSAYWLRLDGSSPTFLGRPRSDVAFSGTSALLLYGENGTMTRFNLAAGNAELVFAPPLTGFLDQIEQIGPRQFIVVAGGGGATFLVYDLDTGWGDSWFIELE